MGVQNPNNTEGRSFETMMNWDEHAKELHDALVEGLDDESKSKVEKAFNDTMKDFKPELSVYETLDFNPLLVDGKYGFIPTEPEVVERPSKVDYYLNIAKSVAMRSTCLRRKYGSIVVKDDVIVSTGYNGAPRGRKNCTDIGYCYRQQNNIPSGSMYEACRSSHSEMNALIFASRDEMKNATLYLVGVENDGLINKLADCCSICKRLIINSGINKVIIAKDFVNGSYVYDVIDVNEWIEHDDSLPIGVDIVE